MVLTLKNAQNVVEDTFHISHSTLTIYSPSASSSYVFCTMLRMRDDPLGPGFARPLEEAHKILETAKVLSYEIRAWPSPSKTPQPQNRGVVQVNSESLGDVM